jgi:uncharacterized membrane protein
MGVVRTLFQGAAQGRAAACAIMSLMRATRSRPLLRSFSVPLLYAVAAVGLGLVIPRLEARYLPELAGRASAPAAMTILSAIASGMMALTGIVFSLAFVMVQFSATAYSPRLVLWLARSIIINHSIGIFTATFIYSLAAIAWVDRGGSAKVPPLTVWFAILLLLASVVVFVLLVDRVGMLQVTRVLAFAGDAGRAVIGRMYPRPDAAAPGAGAEGPPAAAAEVDRVPITQTLAHRGPPAVIQAFDVSALAALASRGGAVVSMAAAVGDTVMEGMPLLRVHGGERPLPERRLRRAVALGSERTFEQDPKYALRLLVDVAIKALSPAINDPTTAVQALDQIEDLLLRLGQRRLDVGHIRDAGARLRLVVPVPTWEDLLVLALDEIRFCGANSIQVMRRMRALLQDLVEHVLPERREGLRHYLERVDKGIERAFEQPDDRLDALERDRQGLGLSRERRDPGHRNR